MSQETPSPGLTDAELEAAVRNGTVNLREVLRVCAFVGKQLQGIPRIHRTLAISGLLSKAPAFHEQGNDLAALMITVLASSWQNFENE